LSAYHAQLALLSKRLEDKIDAEEAEVTAFLAGLDASLERTHRIMRSAHCCIHKRCSNVAPVLNREPLRVEWDTVLATVSLFIARLPLHFGDLPRQAASREQTDCPICLQALVMAAALAGIASAASEDACGASCANEDIVRHSGTSSTGGIARPQHAPGSPREKKGDARPGAQRGEKMVAGAGKGRGRTIVASTALLREDMGKKDSRRLVKKMKAIVVLTCAHVFHKVSVNFGGVIIFVPRLAWKALSSFQRQD